MERQEEQAEGAVYSANMKQIETTNRLLAHIEDKLQNLITNKKTPTAGAPRSNYERSNEPINTAAVNAKITSKQQNSFNMNNSSDTRMGERSANFRKDTNQLHQYPPTGHSSYGKSNLEYQQQLLNGTSNNLSGGKVSQQQRSNRSCSAINNGGNARAAAAEEQQQQQQQQQVSSSTSSSRNRLHELNELLLGREDQSQFTAGTSKQQTQGGTLEYTKSPQKSQKSVIAGSEQEQLLQQQQHIPCKLFYEGFHHEGYGDNTHGGVSESYRELSKVNKLLLEERERNLMQQETFQREILRLREQFQKKSVSDDAVISKLRAQCQECEQEVAVLAREKSVLVESLQNEIQELKAINAQMSQENTSLRIAAIQGRTENAEKNYSSSYRSLKNTIVSQRDRDRESTLGMKDIDRVRDKENQMNSMYLNSNNNYSSINTPNYGTIQNSSIREQQQQMYGNNSNGHLRGRMGMEELQEITNENTNNTNNTKMHTTFSQNDIFMKQSGQNELARIREELARQQAESTRMAERIQEFKSINQQQQSQQLSNQLNAPPKENGNNSNRVLTSDAQILLENYRLYAQQLEKSYEKLESVYQRESNDKQQIICQLQNSISQGYLQQPNQLSFQSQQAASNTQMSKPKNNISRKNSAKRTVVQLQQQQSGKNQRSKSLLNSSKRI